MIRLHPSLSALLLFAPTDGLAQDWRAAERHQLAHSHYKPHFLWRTPAPSFLTLKSQGGYILLGNGKRWRVISSETGKTKLEVESCSDARISAGYLLATRRANPEDYFAPGDIELWDIASRALVASVKDQGVPKLGGVLGGKLFFGNSDGLNRYDWRKGEFEQIRGKVEREIAIGPDRVYSFDGHRLYGLDPSDFSRGWSAYCDGPVRALDGRTIYGTSFGYRAFRIDPGGGLHWLTFNDHGYEPWYARIAPALGKSALVLPGELLIHRDNEVLSPYLFGISKESGALLWKQAVAASDVAAFGDKVVDFGGHRTDTSTQWSPYNPDLYDLESRIEVRSIANGSLLWHSAVVQPGPDSAGILQIATDKARFFVLVNGRLSAYR